MSSSPSSSSGNVLFLILIAVALFAALSYAVTSSTRSGGGDASKEKVILAVNQFEQFKSSVNTSYLRLKMNGCSIESINVLNALTSGMLLVPYSSSGVLGNSCDLYSTNGGGVVLPYSELPATYGTYFNNPSLKFGPIIFTAGTIGLGSAEDDLLLIMPYDPPDTYARAICAEVNKRQDMPDIDDAAAFADMSMNNTMKSDIFCNDQAMFIVVDVR